MRPTSRIYGSDRRFPTNGSCLRNVKMTGKKSLYMEVRIGNKMYAEAETCPNKFRNPKISTMNPTNGHLKNTSKIPPRKHAVPLIFCFRAKK